MKILLLFLLLSPSLSLAANSYSTGTVVFTLPSTSTEDQSKNWATKNNDNWQAAATALSSLQSSTAAIQTSLSGKINAGENNAGVIVTSMTTGLAATVENSTRAATITVGGEIVYSSATPPFFPGAWWSAQKSSCTITSTQFVVKNPSLGGAVFPFYAVQQSSWQWTQYGSLVVSTGNQRSIMKTEAIVVNSSNSFILGVASAPVSNPASNLGLWFQYWCNP